MYKRKMSTDIGLISPEAQRSLGIIVPDITTELGALFLGTPITTWAVVMGMTGLGAGVAGYAATRTYNGALMSGLGGIVGAALGIASANYISKLEFEKLTAQSVQS